MVVDKGYVGQGLHWMSGIGREARERKLANRYFAVGVAVASHLSRLS